MFNLSRSQIWLLGSFISVLAVLATTWFLEGNIQTFAYVAISMAFAFFAASMSSGQKQKND